MGKLVPLPDSPEEPGSEAPTCISTRKLGSRTAADASFRTQR